MYQYRWTKIFRSSAFIDCRKRFRHAVSTMPSSGLPSESQTEPLTPAVPLPPGTPPTHSASSSSARAVSPPPRFSACFFSYRFSARFRVIFPRKAFRNPGRWGGIAFHAFIQVSFTHSSASSALYRMFQAMVPQYFPYFLSVSRIASSERSQYRSMICSSCIIVSPYL